MATFLRQAAAVYPDNADVSRQLILLGDTIGKSIRENRQRERLLTIGNALQTGGLSAGMKAAAGEGLLGEALTMQGMLETQKNRAADDAWRRDRATQSDKQWAAGHGLQAAQLKIAQDAASRAAASDKLKMGLLTDILGRTGGGTPAQAPINAPTSWPVAADAPGLLTVPNAPAPATPAASPVAAPPSTAAGASPQPDPYAPFVPKNDSGLPASTPKMELALTAAGLGPVAKMLADNRANQGSFKDVKERFDVETGLRKEFTTLSKDFSQVRDAYGRIQASAKAPSAAGDLALIFNYMKMLDPGSTVREGEFATAQNAAGIPEIVRAQWNKALTGERLTDNTRNDFVTRAGGLFKTQERQHKKLTDQYKGIAKRLDIDERNVTPDYGLSEDSPQAPQSSGAVDWKSYFGK